MKRILIPFSLFLLTLTSTFTSCVQDDIDNLQNQIDDLDQKVSDMEQAQQEALLAEIAKLEESLTELNGEYDAVLDDLTDLEEEIANNEKAVYYGNILTDTDYAAFTAQGATVVSGKVIVSSDSHIEALAGVKLIGGNVEITGGTSISFPSLEAISGSLQISQVVDNGSSVEFAKLVSVGGDISIKENESITSISANALVYVDGSFNLMDNNDVLTTLSLNALDYVDGDFYINNISSISYDKGFLESTEFSYVDVNGDVYLYGLGSCSVTFGSVYGDLIITETNIVSLEMTGSNVDVLDIDGCGYLFDVSFPNLTEVNEDFILTSNKISGGFGIGSKSTSTDTDSYFDLSAFDDLKYIGGQLKIQNNYFGEEMVGLNNLELVKGDFYTISSYDYDISISGNGNLNSIEMFNSLSNTYNDYTNNYVNIYIVGDVAWFDSFQSLSAAGNIYLELTRLMDETTYEWSSELRIDGFDLLTSAETLYIGCFSMTAFNAFSVLSDLNAFTENFLYIEMPYIRDNMTWEFTANDVDMCSLSTIFTAIQTEEKYFADGASSPVFQDPSTYSEVDATTSMATLTDGCTE